MQSSKTVHVIIFMLIGTFLVTGIPFFVSEDANCDNLIDLKDAVLNAQRIASDRDGNAEITCESTMQAVAGVKDISPGSLETDDVAFADTVFLIPETDTVFAPLFAETILEITIIFNSIDILPLNNPPILV